MTALNDTEKYLTMIAGDRPGNALINVRWRKRTPTGENAGMASSFHHTDQQSETARRLVILGQHTDVYVGVALRQYHSGSRRAVAASHLVWCEIDRPDAELLLKSAPVPATVVVASGGPGRLHAYWQLLHPCGVGQIEAANRALAANLAGDAASTDISRILRPPGTVNHKRCPLTPVRLVTHEPSRIYAIDEVVGKLRDPNAQQMNSHRGPRGTRPSLGTVGRSSDVYEALKAISPRHWVEVLTGEQANADGKVHCPIHADHSPSLHLYNDGAWCFAGCGPVDIFDCAAATWGLDARRDFKEIKWRLAERLLGSPPAGHDQTATSIPASPRRSTGPEQPTAVIHSSNLTQGAEL
jgi:hypothetical protein